MTNNPTAATMTSTSRFAAPYRWVDGDIGPSERHESAEGTTRPVSDSYTREAGNTVTPCSASSTSTDCTAGDSSFTI